MIKREERKSTPLYPHAEGLSYLLACIFTARPLFSLVFADRELGIRLLHIYHNARYLPPKILHKHCFQFPLGRL